MGSQKFSAALNGSEQGERTMQVSREQFMELGYLALREVTPAGPVGAAADRL